jgi:hypothetical protein
MEQKSEREQGDAICAKDAQIKELKEKLAKEKN